MLPSIAACVERARRQLRDAGIAAETAGLDARLLAQHALGWTTERFLTDRHTTPPDGFDATYDALIRRRAHREPVAYIVGHREFWGLDIEVTPDVLVPRPETELLVEALLEWFPSSATRVRIADACTGSGCVAIAIARERPLATLTATDISDTALSIARRNAERHGVARQIELVCADLLHGVVGPFDAIVANPPYVPYCDRSALDAEVAHAEPALAIFAGEDGLSVIEPLVAQAAPLIKDGGALMFEFGYGQDDAVAELIAKAPGLQLFELRCDLQGIPRVAVAQRA